MAERIHRGTREATKEEWAKAREIIAGLPPAAPRPSVAAFALPSIVKATSTSGTKWTYDGMTLTHIANTADLATIGAIFGDTTEYVIGTSLITNTPENV